jgi:hypothetical protein
MSEKKFTGFFSGLKSLPLTTVDVESVFGPRPSLGGIHYGVDLVATKGSKVFAVADGLVKEVRVQKDPVTQQVKGWGLFVRIEHGPVSAGGLIISTLYAHLSTVDSKISVDKVVKAGDLIGQSGGDPNDIGTAGSSTGPHLHFEIRQGNFKLDPLPFIRALQNRLTVDDTFVTAQVIESGRKAKGQSTGALIAGAQRAVGTGAAISPYIASLDSFHPSIQYELTRRSYATNTVQTHMPFVRLTSLSTVLPGNSKLDVVYCPSLGPHGEPRIDFEDIYTPQDNRSVIGYGTTTVGGVSKRVPVVVDNTTDETDTDETDAPNIPMPGITSMTTERSTAGPMGTRGGLFKANVKITAHSVGQLNGLLRYFLRPATRVILEFGRMSSNLDEEIVPFNWNRSIDKITDELEPLVTATKDQRDFIKTHVYGSKGNYDIFIGYVVNFKLNYTGKNTYEIDLTIHSIQQFEVPVRLTGVRSLCSTSIIDDCKVLDISGYFNPDENWRANQFDQLLAKVSGPNSAELTAWKSQVIELKSSDDKQSAGYLISWRFFTDVVLNNDQYGLLSIFQLPNNTTDTDERALLTATKELLSKALLSPADNSFVDIQPDKLINSQVSWHESLRSIDPGVMLIYNPTANTDTETTKNKFEEIARAEKDIVDTVATDIREKIVTNTAVGEFSTLGEGNEEIQISSLYKGVWINTNAIRKAFDGSDTISVALNKLLMFMNSATDGYWNLQLLSSDTDSPGVHVVDMGLSKPINKTVIPAEELFPVPQIDKFLAKPQTDPAEPKYLYQFNRKTRRFQSDDIGSELLDIKLEASMPQVIAVQAIAGVGGVGQQGTWNAIDVDELKRITLFPSLYPDCSGQPTSTCAGETNTELEKIDNELAAAKQLLNSALSPQNLSVASGTNPIPRGLPERIAALEKQKDELTATQNPKFANLAKSYLNSFGTALVFIENDKTDMAKKLGESPDNRTTHPFNSSNLTKTTVDLTLPGIGGLQLFQSFSVARVPNILKSGYYIVTKINHEFTLERGWITKIQGRFRYKPQERPRTAGPALPTSPLATPTQISFTNPNIFSGIPVTFPTNTQSPLFRP